MAPTSTLNISKSRNKDVVSDNQKTSKTWRMRFKTYYLYKALKREIKELTIGFLRLKVAWINFMVQCKIRKVNHQDAVLNQETSQLRLWLISLMKRSQWYIQMWFWLLNKSSKWVQGKNTSKIQLYRKNWEK